MNAQSLTAIDFDSLAEVLELTIDRYCLADVLATIAEICLEKSEHLEVNWQDKTAAKEWLKAYQKLDKVVSSINI